MRTVDGRLGRAFGGNEFWKFIGWMLPAELLPSFSTVSPHRNGDKSGEILNQNCGALGLNDPLRCPITKQSANCALRGACHLGQVLARQIDPRAWGRSLPLQDETQQNFRKPLGNTVGGKFMNPAL